MNISGVVLAKHAPNKANAMKLIEWLVGDKAQHMYADINYEYPVRAGIAINPTIAGYGTLKADPIADLQDRANTRRLRQTWWTRSVSTTEPDLDVVAFSDGNSFSETSA